MPSRFVEDGVCNVPGMSSSFGYIDWIIGLAKDVVNKVKSTWSVNPRLFRGWYV